VNQPEIFAEAPWLSPALALTFGLAIGSFVNVVIYRLPLRKSVVSPPSACPACGEFIRPYDNIPVLSYIFLWGRCRHCKSGISPRYPCIEAFVGLTSLYAFLRHGLSLELACELGFVVAMVALVFIDYDHRVLPNVITLPGTVVGLLVAYPRVTITLTEALLGAALGAGLLYLVAEVYFRIRNIEGLGMGDVKMMGMVGAFLGWKGVLLTLFMGSFVGSIIGLGLMAARGKDLKTALPFGTFLGIAAIVTVYVGPFLMDWYSGFF
jgi:leader peptidase (prepilin peptidase)/N-methyltransferase